jgi:hypothetical protein
LLLEEVGLDPTVVAKTVKVYWERNLSKWMACAIDAEANDNANHVYLLVTTSMMTANWKKTPSLVLRMERYRDPTLPLQGQFAKNNVLAALAETKDRPLVLIDFTIYANRLNLNLPR